MVRGRLVLLHDEHAGGHAADRELLVALDARGLGPSAAELGQQHVDRGRVALRMQAQLTVLPPPAHPAREPELARAPRRRRRAAAAGAVARIAVGMSPLYGQNVSVSLAHESGLVDVSRGTYQRGANPDS